MLRFSRFTGIAAAVALAAAVSFLLQYMGAKAQPTASFPFGTLATTTGTSSQIIGANPTRRAIQICNGTGGVASVAPVPVTPTAANGVQIPVSTCFTSPALTASGTSGGAGAAWNGIGSTTLTILEW